MSAITDLLAKASNGTAPVVTTLASQKSSGANTVALSLTTGWPTTTAVHGLLYKIDANNKLVPGSLIVWKATLAGTTLSNFSVRSGTDDVYPAGSVIELAPTSSWADDLVTALLVAHNQDGSLIGSAVRAALGQTGSTGAGWTTLGATTNTVVANGNRSYTCTINGTDETATLSAGMRLMAQRTVAAPVQSTSLNGSTQFYSRSSASVAGMTFTDDFVVSAWIKLSAYGTTCGVVSRYNGTSGWLLFVAADGTLVLRGQNASSGNYSGVHSFQAVPINKWVHISAQLDMSSFSASPTTSYVTMDGVDVPAFVERAGTNPTALIQAGNFEIGSFNAGNTFNGKIAQVAVYSAKVTEATILASMNQSLAGNESSLISAYSFSNTIQDLNTGNGNDLTANASAVATNADTPFTDHAGVLSYGIIMSVSFSTNTTMVVQVPEGMTLPSSGGITTLSYSGNKDPFGFPSKPEKWTIETDFLTGVTVNSLTGSNFYNLASLVLGVPIGSWILGYSACMQSTRSSGGTDGYSGLGTTTSAVDADTVSGIETGATPATFTATREKALTLAAATPYYLNHSTTYSSNVNMSIFAASAVRGISRIYAKCGLL